MTADPLTMTPSRLTVAKPGSEKVSVYVPGLRSSIRYRPAPSVTVVRTFSINAGLAASTVTPGSTAPDESFTAPASTACAQAVDCATTRHVSIKSDRINTRIQIPLLWVSNMGTQGTPTPLRLNFTS